MDGVLLAALAFACGALAVVSPWHVTAVAVAVTLLAGSTHRIAWGWLALSALALMVGMWRAHTAIGQHEDELTRARAAFARPSRCSGHATVLGSPQRARGGLRWDAAIDGISCDGRPLAWSGRATLYGGPSDLARGDEAEIVAQLAQPERFWNDATGDPRPLEARRGSVRSGGVVDARLVRRAHGVLAWIDRLRARVRERIEATFPPNAAPMARALVLGETDLAPDDDAAFRASGLSHLLAVSGMHLVLVVTGAVAAMRAILVRIEALAARTEVGRIAAAAGIPLAWAYAIFAGASGSTLRAACMTTAALLAHAAFRTSDGPRALAVSMIAMTMADPLVAFDVSFVLSAAATAGILALAGPLACAMEAKIPAFLAPVARSFAVTVAATLPCAPVLARFSPTLALGGLLANLVAVPIGESAALPLCLVHALLSPIPAAERGCALAGGGALLVVREIARAFAAIPGLCVPVPPPTAWQLAALSVAAFAWALAGRVRVHAVVLTVAAVLVLEIDARREGNPRGVLRVTFLDVGQGDAAFVDLPTGGALLIDGGGIVGSPVDTGARVIAPALRARRRDALEAVILSHPHPDHFGGLLTGTSRVEVRGLWDTGQGEREGLLGGYAALLADAQRRKIPLFRPNALCGSRVISGATIDVLAPCPEAALDRGANDNSFVVRIAYGRNAFLFMGDAEHMEESELLRIAPDRLRADVLKVGHHGSRTSSSPELLTAVGARDAVISTGVRNRFGHPHAVTLDALETAKIRIWRTDRHGAITVTTDGNCLHIVSPATRPLHPGDERATRCP